MADDKKYYLCTFLKPGNVYASIAMDVDPAVYIISHYDGIVAMINAHEITEEHYNKMIDMVKVGGFR